MSLTTMMKQYLQIKDQYKDAILLYRLGDFYEMFFDDAIAASEALGLTLTGRDCGLSERAPMCGVPCHSAAGYISKLVEKGFKAAICEQITKAGEQKGLIERRVVKIVTKGTLIDSEFLSETSNNYLASVYYDKEKSTIGVAWTDVSTGELSYQSITEKLNVKLNEILSMLMPSEIICNEDMLKESTELSIVKFGSVCPFSLYDESSYDYQNASTMVSAYFKNEDLNKIKRDKESVCALGSLLSYVKANQKKTLSHLSIEENTSSDEFMSIDFSTRKNLEILETVDCKLKGSLLWVIDRTSTSMGARRLKNWLTMPVLSSSEINERLDCVEELFSNQYLADQIIDSLKQIKDLERLNAKISSSEISPKDLRVLANSLSEIPKIKAILEKTKSARFATINARLDPHDEITALLLSAIDENPPATTRDGGFIKTGYDNLLDEYRNLTRDSKAILQKLEQEEREETGIKNLKISYNRVFGYFIEVTKPNLSLVPYRYTRKQTVATGERFFTEELKELEEKILGAEDHATTRELAIFDSILDKLKKYIHSILDAAKGISYLDCLVSHSIVSRENSYVKPVINESIKRIRLLESRHPVVETLLKSENFVPNDVLLDEAENRINLITGPNMAGKSVYMRQVAIITILAHIGCFVPAKNAEITLTDKIFTRIGASDDMGSGRSTFMVEMSECQSILLQGTPNSLILLDEVGRGTATYDGMSIAYGIIKYIATKIGAKTLFATHYHELTELEGVFPGIKNYHVGVKEFNGDIVFLRKLLKGAAGKSYGIEVARLAGIPNEVIEDARQILKHLESQSLGVSVVGEKKAAAPEINESPVLDPLVSKLQKIDTDVMSPMEALNFLVNLKKEANRR